MMRPAKESNDGLSSSFSRIDNPLLPWSVERVMELQMLASECPARYFDRDDAAHLLVQLIQRATQSLEKRDEAISFFLGCLWQKASIRCETEKLAGAIVEALPSIKSMLQSEHGRQLHFEEAVVTTLHHELVIEDYHKRVRPSIRALIVAGSLAYGKFYCIRPTESDGSGSDIDLFVIISPSTPPSDLIPAGWTIEGAGDRNFALPLPYNLDGMTLKLSGPDRTPVTLNVMSSGGFAKLCNVSLDREAHVRWLFPRIIAQEKIRFLDGSEIQYEIESEAREEPDYPTTYSHKIPLLLTGSKDVADSDRHHSIGLGGIIYSFAPFFDVRSTDEESLILINRLRETLANLDLKCWAEDNDILRSHIRFSRLSTPAVLDRLGRSRVIYPQ